MTTAEYMEKKKQQAIEAFKDHQLILNQEDRWRIALKYEDGKIRSEYATEIISLWGGRLFVGGDIDDCVFGYYSGNLDEKPHSNFHLNKLAWIGKCNDVDYYVLQKAHIGMTDSGKLTERFEPDIAICQLRDQIEVYEEDDENDPNIEVIEEVIELVKNSECDENILYSRLWNRLEDPSLFLTI